MTETTDGQKTTAAPGTRRRLGRPISWAGPRAAAFLRLLPALAAGLLALRAAELLAGMDAGTAPGLAAKVWLAALGLDLLSLARHLPLLFLASLPFLPRGGGAPSKLGFFWSGLLALQLALTQYFFLSGVPLGSDLFAYTLNDIVTTVAGAGGYSPALFVSFFAAVAALWGALRFCPRLPAPPEKAALLVLAAAVPLLPLTPRQPGTIAGFTEHQRSLAVNKTAYFLDETIGYLNPLKRGAAAAGASSGMDLGRLDPKYPFLREERTYDTLGPLFKPGGPPPNFVFFIAEGLGRGFSGPGAVFGSFTPKLDKLAGGGLYWENFLANQGRTFGVLPSLFGSMPFGKNGLAELGDRMPPHLTLPGLLKRAGWGLRVYCGFKADFDNDRAFYAMNGADSITDELSFGPGYEKSTSWGYADRELVSRYLQAEAGRRKEPFITVLKTSTMHTPYKFRGQEAYYPVFERRLDELGVPEAKKDSYRKYRDIYTCMLYFDDEVSRLITELQKGPEWKNTVFVLTGDHRLPEIPMTTRLSRYYVPLIMLSPRLKAPARFRSVSSQLDLAPALLAFLSANYGFKTPRRVAWLGAGLDTAPQFRSVQTFPMMQTKTDLVDFVSGLWYLNQDTVYRLGDSMQISPSDDKEALRAMRAKFAAFRAANDQLARTNVLLPPDAGQDLAPYVQAERLKLPESLGEKLAPGLAVREVRAPDSARPGGLTIEATFACPGKAASPVFVPLVVLMTDDAKELTETYGGPQQLRADGSVTVRLEIKSAGLKPGRYYLAVIPSHPDTGKAVGAGKYKIPVQLAGR